MTKFAVPVSQEHAAIGAGAKHPLMTKTDAQIDTYIDNNVTNLAEARAILKQIVKLQRDMMRYVAKRVR